MLHAARGRCNCLLLSLVDDLHVRTVHSDCACRPEKTLKRGYRHQQLIGTGHTWLPFADGRPRVACCTAGSCSAVRGGVLAARRQPHVRGGRGVRGGQAAGGLWQQRVRHHAWHRRQGARAACVCGFLLYMRCAFGREPLLWQMRAGHRGMLWIPPCVLRQLSDPQCRPVRQLFEPSHEEYKELESTVMKKSFEELT